MQTIYLTPASIGYLTQLILALVITAYFVTRNIASWRRGDRAAHMPLLAVLFAAVAVVVLLFFLDAALPPSPRLYAVYLENTAIGVLLTLLTQFAYRFPRLYPERKWEARIALGANLLYTLWEAGFAIHRGRLLLQEGSVFYRPHAPDYVLVACFLLVPLAFLRQTIAASRHERDLPGLLYRSGLGHLWRPQGAAARATRAFVLIFLIPVGLSLLNLGRAVFDISPAVFQSSMSAGILLTQFLFALVYLNATPEMTSFQIRLVGIALVMTLMVFGAVGWVVTPPYAAAYRPALADQQTLRFTPNAGGGYDVAPVEFHFDPDLGDPLDFQQDDAAGVAFTFPFYGQTAHTLWVRRSGVVSMDEPTFDPYIEYHYGPVPAIFPLYLLSSSDEGGVFARQEAERLTLTWYQMRAAYGRPGRFTFQAVLYADGVFEITTDGLPDLSYQPDASPFTNVWVMGALPRWAGETPQLVNFAQAPLQGGPQGMVQDHYLEFRSHLHRLLFPLALLIVGSSLFVIVGFPIAFYTSLIRPLDVLLEGVRRVNAGDLETVIPVQQHDEIGFLAEVFNDMVVRLRGLVTGLEARVAERTYALAQTNAQLRQEALEREKAQSLLLRQQRDLAALTERERIARELHDSLGQDLSYISAQSQAAQALFADGKMEQGEESIARLSSVAAQMHLDIREYIAGVKSAVLLEEGLGTALEHYVRRFNQFGNILAELTLPSLPDAAIEPSVKLHILRIVQEALTNARKHAQASRAWVTLTLEQEADGQVLQVVVQDDGVGFTPSLPRRDAGEGCPHFGLEIMRERAQEIGGSLRIESAPGQGARVIICAPLAPLSPLR